LIPDSGSQFAYQSPKQSAQSRPTTYDTLFWDIWLKGHARMHANKIQDKEMTTVLALFCFLLSCL